MKKKKSLMLIALLMMVGLTSGYVASTYAKYTAEITGNEGTVTVAKWAFDTDNTAAEFDVDLTGTIHASTLVAERIAPGTEGSFNVHLVNTNSEVGVDFTVALNSVTDKPTNLKFYKDSAHTTELVPGTDTVTGQLTAKDSTGIDVPIYWAWAYETGTSPYTGAGEDPADTTDGKAAKELTIGVTVTGVQTQPGAQITTHIN